jgi:toxin HigB-1
MAIASFADRATEDVFNGVDSRRAPTLPVVTLAGRRAEARAAERRRSAGLRLPPGNRLEVLSGDRAGQQSIRINDQYRVCFRWTGRGFEDVEITDYH